MILEDLLQGLLELICSLFYGMFSGICLLIDFIKTIFYKLCGIETVEIEGEQGDLLSNLLESNIIKRVFLTIFIIGFILLIVFTILAIIKSNYQEKQNWKTVLSKTGQAFIIMLLIPFTVIIGVMLTNTIMSSINQAMNVYPSSGQGTIGGQFLITIGHDAYKGLIDQSQAEAMFVSGELNYAKLSVVKQYYDITELNYVIGLLGSLVMLIMFVISAITFVQRIFDIVLLYIISPVSISTIPLDEGNRFKVWKDMLISKILSAYGIILVMNLFFLIIPQVYQIKFFDNSFQNGVVYILFLIGGSFAVTKASRVISQLTGAPATGGEMAQMIYNIRSALAFTRATKGVVNGIIGGAVGGSDYKQMRKKGKTKGESLNASLHSTRNQRVVQEGQKKSKAKQIGGFGTRLATLPVGILRDFSKGGLIQVGKNFIPRMRNLFTGDTMISRADILKKAPKQPVNENPSNNNDEVIDDNPNVNVDENQREVDSILDNQDEVINNDDNDNIDNVDNNNDSMNSDRNNDSINDSNDNNNPNNNDDNNGGGK
ncbi:MAG: hypothetical protein IJ966_02615 [Bacilli bacterium]|nr:hypothetical protein [Bacilli bacterium]